MLVLYKSFVRPHIEYANVVWSPYLKRQSSSLERVQRRATKMLTECKDMSYEQRIKYLNLHSVKGRRIRGDLLQTFKIINGLDDVCPDELFPKPIYNSTRNSDGKIFIQHCKKDKRKFFFSNRVAPIWNRLPQHVKDASDLNVFKMLIDENPILKELFVEFD